MGYWLSPVLAGVLHGRAMLLWSVGVSHVSVVHGSRPCDRLMLWCGSRRAEVVFALVSSLARSPERAVLVVSLPSCPGDVSPFPCVAYSDLVVVVVGTLCCSLK